MNTLRLWPSSLVWPLPAVLGWALAWGVFIGVSRLGAGAVAAFVLALLASALPAWSVLHWWRRLIVLAGFPLSLLALGAAPALPAWAWPLALLPLLLAYPLRAWSDAPFFPTAHAALDGLQQQVQLAPGASVLDAGCGMGHGLRALQRVWPEAVLHGVEWSRPLAFITRLRMPSARVARGDMWAGSWAEHDLVYLFQRPESMARAWAKACGEMAPGRWFVSLAFEVPGARALTVLHAPGRRPVYVYRVPARSGRS